MGIEPTTGWLRPVAGFEVQGLHQEAGTSMSTVADLKKKFLNLQF